MNERKNMRATVERKNFCAASMEPLDERAEEPDAARYTTGMSEMLQWSRSMNERKNLLQKLGEPVESGASMEPLDERAEERVLVQDCILYQSHASMEPLDERAEEQTSGANQSAIISRFNGAAR